MRSAARFGLIALAGCPQTSPPPAPELTAKQVFVRSCELYADAWCARRDRCAVSTDRATQGEACLQAAKRGCQAKTAVALDRAFDTFETSWLQSASLRSHRSSASRRSSGLWIWRSVAWRLGRSRRAAEAA